MNYQKVQKWPKLVQRKLNIEQAAKPKVRSNISKNYERQQHIDIVKLYMHNKKLANRPPVEHRMTRDDRSKYIKECREKLGLNDRLFLQSSRRTVYDSQLKKDMPYLEFNDFQAHRQPKYNV